jgi:2-dehydro-3-deoxyglucarate aldolase
MRNKLRKSLLTKELSIGTWIQIGHPACAEILARTGYDWVCVDLEHGAIGIETMTDIFRTLDAYDCVPLARLPKNDPVWIHRTLDAGARGLIIPMVNTADEAEAAVREAKYPPRGRRGFGYGRANMHGIDFYSYIAEANDEIAMIMQIEHKDAIKNVDAILDVEDVDGLFIGPMDLSGSMGITGQTEHPDMTAALDTYLAACSKHGTTAGIHIVQFDEYNIKQAIEKGYTLLALGLDTAFLYESASRTLEIVRKG